MKAARLGIKTIILSKDNVRKSIPSPKIRQLRSKIVYNVHLSYTVRIFTAEQQDIGIKYIHYCYQEKIQFSNHLIVKEEIQWRIGQMIKS